MKTFKITKLMCMVLAVGILCTAVSSCGKGEVTDTVTENASGLPLTDEKAELSAFLTLHSNHAGVGITSLDEVSSVKALEEKTNVHIKWESPTLSNSADVLAQMLASGNYPDIIFGGSGNKMLRQSVAVIPLNDLIEQYGPNIKKVQEQFPDYAYFSKDESGKILSVNSYCPDLRFNGIWCTPMIRQDWLDQLNLPMPATQAEWYETLKAFRDHDMNGNGDKSDEIPLCIYKDWPINYIAFWPLGITNDFYIEDGKVHHGFLEPQFIEGLVFMKKLYDEKLVDTEFLVQNIQQMEKKIQSNLAGACIAGAFNYGNEYKQLLKDRVPDYNMVVAGNLKAENGSRYSFAGNSFQRLSELGCYITTSCKKTGLAMRWIDYLFSEEGGTLVQFGKEGESFDYDTNGKPQFRYDLLKDDKGNINALNRSRYTLGGDGSYGTGFPHWDETLTRVDGKWQPVDKTMIFGSDAVFNSAYEAALEMDLSKLIPGENMLRYSGEELAEVNQLMTDISKYIDETIAQIITGVQPLSAYEQALESVKRMDIERVLEIKQAAYDRIDKSILGQ